MCLIKNNFNKKIKKLINWNKTNSLINMLSFNWVCLLREQKERWASSGQRLDSMVGTRSGLWERCPVVFGTDERKTRQHLHRKSHGAQEQHWLMQCQRNSFDICKVSGMNWWQEVFRRQFNWFCNVYRNIQTVEAGFPRTLLFAWLL